MLPKVLRKVLWKVLRKNQFKKELFLVATERTTAVSRNCEFCLSRLFIFRWKILF